jgi:hypothetical protein
MEFVKWMTCFKYLFTISLFLTGLLSPFEMCAISFRLSLFSSLQSYNRWSTVWWQFDVCVCVCVCVCVWARWIMSFIIKLHMRNVRSVVTKLYTNKLSEETRFFLHIRKTLLISCLHNRLGNVSISVWSFIVVFFTRHLFSFFTLIFSFSYVTS